MEMHSEEIDVQALSLDGVALAPDDQYILTKLNQTIEEVNAHLANTALMMQPSHSMTFWHAFCDQYVEYAKPLLYRGSQKKRTHISNHAYHIQHGAAIAPSFYALFNRRLWEGMGYNHTDVRICSPMALIRIGLALEADTVAYVEAKHDLFV